MTAFVNRVRACDKFGAKVGLNFEGKHSYETIGGGVMSGLLRIIILVYLCMKLLVVFNYKDPQISVYEIVEDRQTVFETLNLDEFHSAFQISFFNPFDSTGSRLDPSIGTL